MDKTYSYTNTHMDMGRKTGNSDSIIFKTIKALRNFIFHLLRLGAKKNLRLVLRKFVTTIRGLSFQ